MQDKSIFSEEEMLRYSRHLLIPEFSQEGQLRLKKSSVLVVGAGGLGSPVLYYLAAAGTGTIGIVEHDRIDTSNLQRQILYTNDDIGQSKGRVAQQRLLTLNPNIRVELYETLLTSANALNIISNYNLVIDGTDNFPTRYLVNDACVLSGKPYIYGSIYRFEGQVSVFNHLQQDATRGPNYRDLFPTPPPPGMVPGCAEGGVLGVLPGIIGSIMANEAIKVLAGIGEPLSGRLLLLDALSFDIRFLTVKKDPANPLSGNNPSKMKLIDYDEFCGIKNPDTTTLTMKEVTVQQLKTMIDHQETHQLIDVREPYEYDIVNIQGELIPLNTVEANRSRIASDKTVIVMCRSGVRSARIIQMLEEKYGYTNLYNLKGGILAWAREIDNSLLTY